MTKLGERLAQQKDRLFELYARRTPRERGLIAGAGFVAALLVAYLIFQPVNGMFEEQAYALQAAQSSVNSLANDLQKFERLKQRRGDLERQFKSVDFKEGALSYLEGLVRDKAGIPGGSFTLEDSPPKPFGTSYEKTTFSIKFATVDFNRLVEFLREVVDGPKPLVLQRLDMKRSRSGDRIEVQIDVSSIRRAK